MAKPDYAPRAMALVAARPVADATLNTALRDDLLEVLQFLRLRADKADAPATIAKAVSSHNAPSIVAFSDVPGLPPDCAEGALDLTAEADVVVGPCADGSVYLLAFAEGLPAPTVEALVSAALLPDGLAKITSLLSDLDVEVATMPPWFRAVTDKDLSFAECLTRLSLMGDESEQHFVADRLQLWLEKRQ